VDEPGQVHSFSIATVLSQVTVREFEQRIRQLCPSPVSPSTLDPRTWTSAQTRNA
jgi:hypothetical protein